jgi:hypothetical protein
LKAKGFPGFSEKPFFVVNSLQNSL